MPGSTVAVKSADKNVQRFARNPSGIRDRAIERTEIEPFSFSPKLSSRHLALRKRLDVEVAQPGRNSACRSLR
jgi:hypothetical protein